MPPNASANGPTNGIEPPTPMSTGSTPKPARSARRAASNAGPVGSVSHAGAPSPRVEPQLESPRDVPLDVRAQLRDTASGS